MEPEKAGSQFIDKVDRFKRMLKSNPLNWVQIFRIVLSTLKSRFLYRCIGKNTIVGTQVSFINFSNIKIGSDSLVLDHVYMRAGLDGYISIGKGCAINSYAKIFGHGGVTIGEHSQMGPDSLITTTSHDIGQSMKTEFKAVTVGNWAWIGAKAMILPGITIGNYAVIGAGSVVTKDIPDYAIAVGNPARIIGENEVMKESNNLFIGVYDATKIE